MHRCPGNDDFENTKIYEESLHPEGIKNTTRVRNRNYTFERPSLNIERIKSRNIHFPQRNNMSKDTKFLMNIIPYIFLVIFILFLFIIMI